MTHESWRSLTIGDVCRVETGGTPSRQNPEYWGGSIPWMASGEIHQRRVSRTSEFITDAGLNSSNTKWLPAGTVMLAMNGQGKTRGSVAILQRPMTCNQSLAGLIAAEDVLVPDFLLHWLESQYQMIRDLTGDEGRNGLNLRLIRNLELPVPPLPEQKKIAAILGSVDDAIQATQAVIEQTRKLKAGLMQRLMNRGIGPEHHCDSWEMAPDGWMHRSLGDFATLQRGFDLPVQSRHDGGVPVIASNGPVGAHSEARVAGPGVVTGRSGTIGKVMLIHDDFWPLNTTLYVKDFHGNDPRFVAYFLGHFDLTRFATGTGVPTLNRNDVHAEPIRVPPLPEQKKIAAILGSVDDAIHESVHKLEGLKALKAGLMSDLLSGRVRVEVPA